MREIKFRAKNLSDNKWYYSDELGYLFWQQLEHGDLDKKTLGQFTGLKDKKGKEIYEGDVVRWYFNRYPSARKQKRVDEVKFIMGAFIPDVWRNQEVEVIGNVFQNKDLLK